MPTDSLIPMNTKADRKNAGTHLGEASRWLWMWIRFSDGVEGEIDIFSYLAESS